MVNARQQEKLRDIARIPGVRKLVCQSTQDVATLKALRDRGLIRLRYVASRAWDASLTEEGFQALGEEPIGTTDDPGPWGCVDEFYGR